MKQVCKSVAHGSPPQILSELQAAGSGPELRLAVRVFLELQAAGHQADDDVAATCTHLEALKLLVGVESRFRAWRAARGRDEATAFLTPLLLGKRRAR